MKFASPRAVRRLLGSCFWLSLAAMFVFLSAQDRVRGPDEPSADAFVICAGIAWLSAVVALVGWSVLWRIDADASSESQRGPSENASPSPGPRRTVARLDSWS